MTPEIAERLLDARNAAVELVGFIEGHNAASFDDNRGLQLIVHKLLESSVKRSMGPGSLSRLSPNKYRTCSAISVFEIR